MATLRPDSGMGSGSEADLFHRLEALLPRDHDTGKTELGGSLIGTGFSYLAGVRERQGS